MDRGVWGIQGMDVKTRLGWVRSGLEMLFVGALAAAVAYSIGALAATLT